MYLVSSGLEEWIHLFVQDSFVSEYRKRDLMAQKLFLELLIPSYSMIFEL